eukprot:COSAG04_NODE_328_length_16610_cov_3.679668_3_plen_280_part_00
MPTARLLGSCAAGRAKAASRSPLPVGGCISTASHCWAGRAKAASRSPCPLLHLNRPALHLTRVRARVYPQNELERALKAGAIKESPSYAERYGEETKADADYKITDHLPGPLQDMDRDEVLLAISEAGGRGQGHTLWMQWQEQYGDGLTSNIVLPHVGREREVEGSPSVWLTEKVMLSDPDDCQRIARTHTQKDPSFQTFMGDSVISAIDNNAWRAQRNHMTQAFLPTSSLARKCSPLPLRLLSGLTKKRTAQTSSRSRTSARWTAPTSSSGSRRGGRR